MSATLVKAIPRIVAREVMQFAYVTSVCILLRAHADDAMKPLKCLSASFHWFWRNWNLVKCQCLKTVGSRLACVMLWMCLGSCKALRELESHSDIASCDSDASPLTTNQSLIAPT